MAAQADAMPAVSVGAHMLRILLQCRPLDEWRRTGQRQDVERITEGPINHCIERKGYQA
jgi:hypothetical protein